MQIANMQIAHTHMLANMQIAHTQIAHMQCVNCGKAGHTRFKCFEPYTSYGIVLFDAAVPLQLAKIDKKINVRASNKANYHLIPQLPGLVDGVRFLVVRKKHSYSFLEFVLGRYELDDLDGLTSIFEHLTLPELRVIEQHSYDHCASECGIGSLHYESSKAKFSRIKQSTLFQKLRLLVHYPEPEWGFPKGRKMAGESNLECALREFSEETDLQPEDLSVFERVLPLCENYIGTDGHNYRHIYFLAQANHRPPLLHYALQDSPETSEIRWITIREMNKYFRPYQREKKQILSELSLFIIHNLQKQ